MKKILFFFLLFLLLMTGSCSDQRVQMAWLAEMNSLMEKNPQAAYDSLSNHRQDMSQSGEKVEMRYRMLEAKALNKLFRPMPSDSLFQEVVDYYDSKGTPNEKMEAHYLLGCIYRDMKEAPKAMQCYQEAIGYADTLNQKCDYTTLFSIYGQMGSIYKRQYLPSAAIDCYQKYSYYALKSKNVYDYIRGKEFIGDIYFDEGDTAKAVEIAEECVSLYEKHHMQKEAAAALPNIISVYLSKQDYPKAQIYIHKYEMESSLFDSGKQLVGREQYYYYKGQYYMGTSKIDSAEIYFRKLLKTECLFEAYKGLAAVYRTRHNQDSINKYSLLCENALDRVLRENQMDAVRQASSMYSYNRIQKQADENAVRIEKGKWYSTIIFTLLIIVGLMFYIISKKRFFKKQLELDRKTNEHLQTLRQLELLQEEVVEIKESSAQLLKKKMQDIFVLKEKLLAIEKENEKMKPLEKQTLIESNEIYKKFLEMSSGKLGSPVPQESDWKSLFALVKLYYPVFYTELQSRNILSDLEWKVCMLVRLKFASGKILLLFGKSSSIVSNTKKSANKKLFGIDNAASLYKNMLKI